MRSSKKSTGKRVMSLFLAMLVSLSVVIGSSAPAMALSGSNAKINTFIELARGVTEVSEDIDLLSEADLRFLGIYLSNFYIPYTSELGEAALGGDLAEKTTSVTKESMIKALQSGLNYSEDTASALIEVIMGLTRSNIKPLKMFASVEADFDSSLSTSKEMKFDVNGLNFLTIMMGQGQAYLTNEGFDSSYDYIHFCFEENGVWRPVADAYAVSVSDTMLMRLSSNNYTASQFAYLKGLETIDIAGGFGPTVFDLAEEDIGSDLSMKGLASALGSASSSDLLKLSIYGSQMHVDCFGNILQIGGVHQYVVLPGAMNPYTWMPVDSDGEDTLEGTGSKYFNAVNVLSMLLAFGDIDTIAEQEEEGTREGYLVSSANIGSGETFARGAFQAPFQGQIQYSNNLQMVRGSSATNADVPWTFLNGGAKEHLRTLQSEYKTRTRNGTAALGTLVNYPSVLLSLYSIDEIVAIAPHSYQNSSTANNPVLVNMAYIDTLGVFESKEGYDTVNFMSYLESNGVPKNDLFNIENYRRDTDLFKGMSWGSDKVLDTNVPPQLAVALYMTYAVAGLYDSSKKAESIGELGYRIYAEGLPAIANAPLTALGVSPDKMIEDIKTWTYWLLHPTKGINYVTTLISNSLNGFLLGWHHDMLGTRGVGVVTGVTAYRSTTGYVTMPDLSEISWTAKLIDLYNSAIPFIMIIMLVVMLFSGVLGVLSFQRALIGFLIFAMFLFVPVTLINGVVQLSNNISTTIYGGKFTYWALIQHESYASAIDEAATGGDYENYLRTLYATNSAVNANQGMESIILKWQAPKKMASLMFSKNSATGSIFANSSLLSGVISSAYGGESYLDSEDAVYLYRSYLDISNFSRYIYSGLRDKNKAVDSSLVLLGEEDDYWTDSYQAIMNNSTTEQLYRDYRQAGYVSEGRGSGVMVSPDLTDTFRIVGAVTGSIMNNALAQKGTIADMGLDDYVGINQGAFEFAIPMFTSKSPEVKFVEYIKQDAWEEYSRIADEGDYSSLAIYGLYSESPYYYYSWMLYDLGLESTSYAWDGYKNLLLGADNAGFFYNNVGNGELKDFMDMRSLFTYIIPYLKMGNDVVQEWDDVYGVFIYPGVPIDETLKNDREITGNPELHQKYWHNVNVARLYNMYAPWVDVMYDCSYAKPEKIRFLGQTVTIRDPIDPASYPAERPMIFSHSEMLDYGLNESQLTRVERLILKTNEDMQERMFELLNYYKFSDVVLNTAAAMNCTFAFNTNFSEVGLLSENRNIYPQTYELNDFSFDAYLRFILSTTTGQDMASTSDFYETIVLNSSMTTVLVMIILDIFAMYVIPGVKLLFLILVFLCSILMVLTSVFRVDPETKFVKKLALGVFKPTLGFLTLSVGFSWVLSLFMGKGSNAVTETANYSISMGTPVTVMLLLIVINVAVVIGYYAVLKATVQQTIKDAKLVGGYLGALGGTAILSAGALIGGGMLLGGAAKLAGRTVAGAGKTAAGAGNTFFGKKGKDDNGEGNGVPSGGRSSKRDPDSNSGSGGSQGADDRAKDKKTDDGNPQPDGKKGRGVNRREKTRTTEDYNRVAKKGSERTKTSSRKKKSSKFSRGPEYDPRK